jgi:hypothetical protein
MARGVGRFDCVDDFANGRWFCNAELKDGVKLAYDNRINPDGSLQFKMIAPNGELIGVCQERENGGFNCDYP